MEKTFIVIDYNNIRFLDVKKISDYARLKYNLSTTLIRPNLTSVDREIADYCIDLDFSRSDFSEIAAKILKDLNLKPMGGFVFSDRALVAGTKLLKDLSLPHDSLDGSYIALDKSRYRQAEKNNKNIFLKNCAWLPDFELMRSEQDVLSFLMKHPRGIVLKPTCEGNNRGVMIVKTKSQVSAAWELASPYIAAGIIAEELIPFKDEFSFDGIQNLTFITKKLSADGEFPVEIGQQVPALLSTKAEKLLSDNGKLVRDIVGSKVGAFHNEIRFDGKQQIAIVEPNRRPAGMCIWDLAEKVYGINFYHQLVDACLGKPLETRSLIANGVASIRMLKAPHSGIWNQKAIAPKVLLDKILETLRIKKQLNLETEFFQFRFVKPPGSFVESTIKHNGDFVAQICAHSVIGEGQLQNDLDAFEEAWLTIAAEEIHSEIKTQCEGRISA